MRENGIEGQRDKGRKRLANPAHRQAVMPKPVSSLCLCASVVQLNLPDD
ncbi:hypothetical protein RAS1_34510 [Phycisphaerae bacterium RAS1]|nr:hypothetical protein RAS1_34510 [Phycisphaerae bacterium RAS1]